MKVNRSELKFFYIANIKNLQPLKQRYIQTLVDFDNEWISYISIDRLHVNIMHAFKGVKCSTSFYFNKGISGRTQLIS